MKDVKELVGDVYFWFKLAVVVLLIITTGLMLQKDQPLDGAAYTKYYDVYFWVVGTAGGLFMMLVVLIAYVVDDLTDEATMSFEIVTIIFNFALAVLIEVRVSDVKFRGFGISVGGYDHLITAFSVFVFILLIVDLVLKKCQ